MKKILLPFIFVLFTTFVFAQKVYVTKTGSKYHTSSCRYLKYSSFEKSLNDAVAEGYTPCKVCKPPTITKESKSSIDNSSEVKSTETKTKEQPGYTTSKSSTSSGRCQAITKKGTQCTRKAKAGSIYCSQHGG